MKREQLIKKHRKGIKYLIKGKFIPNISNSEHEWDEIDQLNYDLAGVQEKIKWVKGVHDELQAIRIRVADLEKKPLKEFIKERIKRWILT